MENSQKASYCIGFDLGCKLLEQFKDADLELIKKGFEDGLENRLPIIERNEIQSILTSLMHHVQANQKASIEQMISRQQKESNDFLTENRTKEGVRVLSCGLQYRVLQRGKGASPGLYDSVTVHYKGSLISGKQIVNSYEKKSPLTFQMNNCLQGLSEALKKMKPGDKWELVMPPYLAYGDKGHAQLAIPPASTLIFELELLSVNS